MARTANSPEASARPKRTPLAQRNRLAIKDRDPNYHYRIVNDVDDRVTRLQEIGYEIASKEHVGAVGDKRVDGASSLGSVAHFSVGQGTKAVVMRIPKDYATEDHSTKLAEIDAVESTMKKDARRGSDYGEFEASR